MLKRKLKKWGYTKNNSLNDLQAMVFTRRKRRKLGKATLFFKNRKLVDIDGALKRKGLSEITVEVSSTSALPSNVVVRTPSPSPTFIAAPTEFKIQEDILMIYKELLEQWQKTSSSTTTDDYGFSLFSRIEKPCVYHEMGHALSCANLAFDAGYSDLGGSLLKQAFLLAESVVRMESPKWLLVSPWQHLHQARRPEITKDLIHHFHNLSRTLLPNGLVHRFFDSLVEATKSQPLDQFIRTLTPGLMRILEDAPEEILLVRTAIELLEAENKNQTMGLVSQIDKRIRKWQSQIDKRSPSGLIADLDVLHLRLELTRQSGDGMLLIDHSRDFIAQVQAARRSIFENHNENRALRMLDFFTASAFFAMSHGYKLLAKDRPNTSAVWVSESIRLLSGAIDKFNNTVARGAETFKQALHFRRLKSWIESGNQRKAEEDLQEIQLIQRRTMKIDDLTGWPSLPSLQLERSVSLGGQWGRTAWM
jgi:hypothetical protein